VSAQPYAWPARLKNGFMFALAGLLVLFVLMLVLVGGVAPLGAIHVSTYHNLAQAHKTRLFELRAVLPPSTYAIRMTGDVEGYACAGMFRFDPAEWPLLRAKLIAGVPDAGPGGRWAALVEQNTTADVKPWHVNAGATRWSFLCNAASGDCEYFAWDDASSGNPGL
jgi:hypothetical protein